MSGVVSKPTAGAVRAAITRPASKGSHEGEHAYTLRVASHFDRESGLRELLEAAELAYQVLIAGSLSDIQEAAVLRTAIARCRGES